jgi:hypothetical protein
MLEKISPKPKLEGNYPRFSTQFFTVLRVMLGLDRWPKFPQIKDEWPVHRSHDYDQESTPEFERIIRSRLGL